MLISNHPYFFLLNSIEFSVIFVCRRIMENNHLVFVFFFLLIACDLPSKSQCLSWPFSSSSSLRDSNSGSSKELITVTGPTEFAIEVEDRRGRKLVEDARRKLVGPSTCWHNAYRSLFASCSEIIGDKEKQSRLAWQLSCCFQVDSGRPAFPSCDAGAPMVKCLKKLDDLEHKTYLEFFLETNSICHQLQADAFKHDTERLVNELTKSAHFAEEKLETIEEKSEKLLQNSNEVQDSLASIGLQTQQLAQASTAVEEQINDVLKHSKAIFEQSKEIAASQLELQGGQVDMKQKLMAGFENLQESYKNLDEGMLKLREDAVQIEREIQVVGESMSSKMQNLQTKANDIGNVAGMSLEKQKQLLDSQAVALEGLDFLAKFQSQALEESRNTLERLAELGHKQQEELLHGQEQIQQTHDRLIRNSQSILAAQEEFEAKQANIFAALDKLFVLHNAILVESRFIKAFFFYSCVIFLLYMLTSTKQTYSIRARLYLGLCTTFMIEALIVRFAEDEFNQQTRIMSKVFLTRSTFLCAAAVQIIHSLFTFRDYEALNHQMLQTLVEKIRIMEQNGGLQNKVLPLWAESEVSMSCYSWMDEELPDDVDEQVDPDYMFPEEEIGENSITTFPDSRRYNLRPRNRWLK
ncbi:protein GAMETE EXPRESSED 1 [Canna indica]|uniref:Protein GAMETE EXPRESSED 1 n=1 Tax=Canna indica TaxID=4628 RepID=A0AAQ3JRP3_9LILI|nr:protein GAMETE EXPRESSED 1 [Canna indica]